MRYTVDVTHDLDGGLEAVDRDLSIDLWLGSTHEHGERHRCEDDEHERPDGDAGGQSHGRSAYLREQTPNPLVSGVFDPGR